MDGLVWLTRPSLRFGLVWLTRPFPRFGGSCVRFGAGSSWEGEVWKWEGSEVATRGKPAADFKPALNSTLTGFALEIKREIGVQMRRLISNNQTFPGKM